MDARQGAVMTAHLVFFTAVVLFGAARTAGWNALEPLADWPGPSEVAQQPCRPGVTAAGGYLQQLSRTLWAAEGESLVLYDAPECAL